MSDEADDEPPLLPPLSDGEILNLAVALANGKAVDITALSKPDALAVWRIVRAIVRRRREQGLIQPKPENVYAKPTPAMISPYREAGENPVAIIEEIMAEPLLLAALWALSSMTNAANFVPPPPQPGARQP